MGAKNTVAVMVCGSPKGHISTGVYSISVVFALLGDGAIRRKASWELIVKEG